MAKSRYSLLLKSLNLSTLRLTHETFPPIKGKELYSDSDKFIIWDETMRMDILAHQYLGDGKYWWMICLINDLTFGIGGVNNGQNIRIPSSPEFVFNVLNAKRVNV